jgi:type I restriction enzyme S subunit
MSNWNEINIGNIATFSKGRLTEQSANSLDGYLPLINADAVNGNVILFSHTKGAVLCEENDILMLWDGERSGLVTIGHNGVVGSTFSKLQTIDEIDSKFLFYFLQNKFSWIQNNRTGTGVPHVPKDIAKILFVKFPVDKLEQKKIAKILSTTDAVIEKTQLAIAKYKAIKQGMLHDLFTRGINLKTGKLRPKYEDAPELYKESNLGWIPKDWDLDNFENASDLITDFTANGSFETLRVNVKYYYEPKYARLIRLTDLRVNLKNDGVYVDKDGFDFLSKSSLLENDIMLANVGEYTGFACLMPKVDYPATIAPNMFLIRCNLEIFNPLYMYYFMILDFFTRQVDNISASSATKLLNKTNFRKLHIIKPSIIEQEIIGSRLQLVDNKIKTEQEYFQKLQQLKSGLMADLLCGKKLVSVPNELETEKSK